MKMKLKKLSILFLITIATCSASCLTQSTFAMDQIQKEQTSDFVDKETITAKNSTNNQSVNLLDTHTINRLKQFLIDNTYGSEQLLENNLNEVNSSKDTNKYDDLKNCNVNELYKIAYNSAAKYQELQKQMEKIKAKKFPSTNETKQNSKSKYINDTNELIELKQKINNLYKKLDQKAENYQQNDEAISTLINNIIMINTIKEEIKTGICNKMRNIELVFEDLYNLIKEPQNKVPAKTKEEIYELMDAYCNLKETCSYRATKSTSDKKGTATPDAAKSKLNFIYWLFNSAKYFFYDIQKLHLMECNLMNMTLSNAAAKQSNVTRQETLEIEKTIENKIDEIEKLELSLINAIQNPIPIPLQIDKVTTSSFFLSIKNKLANLKVNLQQNILIQSDNITNDTNELIKLKQKINNLYKELGQKTENYQQNDEAISTLINTIKEEIKTGICNKMYNIELLFDELYNLIEEPQNEVPAKTKEEIYELMDAYCDLKETCSYRAAKSTSDKKGTATPDAVESTSDKKDAATPDAAQSTSDKKDAATPDAAQSTSDKKDAATPDAAESTSDKKDAATPQTTESTLTHISELFNSAKYFFYNIQKLHLMECNLMNMTLSKAAAKQSNVTHQETLEIEKTIENKIYEIEKLELPLINAIQNPTTIPLQIDKVTPEVLSSIKDHLGDLKIKLEQKY